MSAPLQVALFSWSVKIYILLWCAGASLCPGAALRITDEADGPDGARGAQDSIINLDGWLSNVMGMLPEGPKSALPLFQSSQGPKGDGDNDGESNAKEAKKTARSSPKSRWYSCTFDWDRPHKETHTFDTTWSFFFHVLKEDFHRLRQSREIKPLERYTNERVMTGSFGMLKSAEKVLNQLNVSWYIAYGSVIGQLRSQGFIPWDDDVDILVKKSDQSILLKWILGDESSASDSVVRPTHNGYASMRSIPGDSNYVAMGHVYKNGTIGKILWVDLETKLAIDFCLDCETYKTLPKDTENDIETQPTVFGPLTVPMAKRPFNTSNLVDEKGVDVWAAEITMPLDRPAWTCYLFECAADPEPWFPEVKDLHTLYEQDEKQQLGPFYFKVVDPEDTSSIPHNGIASSSSSSLFENANDSIVLHRKRRRWWGEDVSLLEEMDSPENAEIVGHGICAMPRKMESCKLLKEEKGGDLRLSMLPCGWKTD
eukprot:TRINITY_DN21695_c0_g1_i3.p1 TRINITY_DN21695_c0_g1~~TRINITY_DN21695_c0_g1_i3.p1  ORF type:complete len:483 (-),score=80.45 TRINITY_DN21695_c0_g1_i3:181-1629(-)